jgi:malonyl-CoA O-methyltransferase
MNALKRRVLEAFDQASGYDACADIQREVAQALARRIRLLPLPATPRVLEIGCGTGFLAEALETNMERADWLMTDIAPAMIERSRARLGGRGDRYRFAVLDGEHPVFAEPEAPFDLVCASLAMQWFDDLEESLGGLFRLVAPGGHLAFSTLAQGTFTEWREAHAGLVPAGTHEYPGLTSLAGLRLDGIAGEVEAEHFVRTYPTAGAFLHSLRAIGASTPRSGYRPLSPASMRAVMRRFEAAGSTSSYCVAMCRFTRPVR